eukprot:10309450-Alexandrium_andersonii.AAC.1
MLTRVLGRNSEAGVQHIVRACWGRPATNQNGRAKSATLLACSMTSGRIVGVLSELSLWRVTNTAGVKCGHEQPGARK